jgi:DNA repair protein RadC
MKHMIYLKDSKLKIGSPGEVAKVFDDLLGLEDAIERDKEHFYVMHLDVRCRVKLVEVVSIGTLTSALVHPRETFRRAVVEGAYSIIIAHNHPSGYTQPSDEDTKVTRGMCEAGRILWISLLDHIIFAKGGYFSFKESKLGY